MKKPDRIKVGPQTWQVEWLPDSVYVDEEGTYGLAHYDTLTISISGVSIGVQVETFLHEVLHACYKSYSIKDKDTEERTVSSLSPVLCAFIRDNPEALLWIISVLYSGDKRKNVKKTKAK